MASTHGGGTSFWTQPSKSCLMAPHHFPTRLPHRRCCGSLNPFKVWWGDSQCNFLKSLCWGKGINAEIRRSRKQKTSVKYAHVGEGARRVWWTCECFPHSWKRAGLPSSCLGEKWSVSQRSRPRRASGEGMKGEGGAGQWAAQAPREQTERSLKPRLTPQQQKGRLGFILGTDQRLESYLQYYTLWKRVAAGCWFCWIILEMFTVLWYLVSKGQT